MLAEETVLGTSTPGADPSGDYAWQLFDQGGAMREAGRQRARRRKP